MKIPKEIADKIEQRNKLVKELNDWFEEREDADGMDFEHSIIVSEPSGEEQCEGEYCDQYQVWEDEYHGHYYYPIEDSTKYVCVEYWCW